MTSNFKQPARWVRYRLSRLTLPDLTIPGATTNQTTARQVIQSGVGMVVRWNSKLLALQIHIGLLLVTWCRSTRRTHKGCQHRVLKVWGLHNLQKAQSHGDGSYCRTGSISSSTCELELGSSCTSSMLSLAEGIKRRFQVSGRQFSRRTCLLWLWLTGSEFPETVVENSGRSEEGFGEGLASTSWSTSNGC